MKSTCAFLGLILKKMKLEQGVEPSVRALV